MPSTTVPFHALIVADDATIAQRFPAHELVHLAGLSAELLGPGAYPELSAILAAELRHRVALKLSLAQRVVVLAADLDADQAHGLARLATGQGATVMHLGSFVGPSDLVPGLSIASAAGLTPALAWPGELGGLAERFRGITVVADVHGNLAAARRAVTWAKARRHFLWFLGDLVDYGPEPLAVIELVYRLVMRGEAGLVLGNHEKKLARWLACESPQQRARIRLSSGNLATTTAIERLGRVAQARWVGRFRALLARSQVVVDLGPSITLAHAAIHPSYWTAAPEPGAIADYALFGEPAPGLPDGQFALAYRWTAEVPAGRTVLVGHDAQSHLPLLVTSTAGGRVVFLDIGCGQGGALASADLRFTGAGQVRLECFGRHLG